MLLSHWIILRMRNVADRSCRARQNAHFTFHIFSRKSCLLLDNMEKYGTDRQTDRPLDDNIIRRMRLACCITKTTDKHSTMGYLLLFHSSSGHANASQCYITRTLPVLLACRPPFPKSATKNDHFTVPPISAALFLSKVCLLNSVL